MKWRDWTLVGLVALAFIPALFSLANAWLSVDAMTHGFMIPVVAVFIALTRKSELESMSRPGGASGLAVIALGMLLAAVGATFESATLDGLGVVVAVCGLTLRFRGRAGLRLLAFPLAFLLFMVPPPEIWLNPVILALQVQVSAAAAWVLRMFGLAILRDGNVILLPDGGTLFVAEACSGITSVLTLTPLGLLFAYYSETSLRRRLILIAWILPAALFGNLLRVVGTVWIAAHGGVGAATSGFLHEWAGVLTYAVACGVLVAVGEVMRRWSPPTREPGEPA